MQPLPSIPLYQGFTSSSGSLYTGPFAAGKFKTPALGSLAADRKLSIPKSTSPRLKVFIPSQESPAERSQTEQDRSLQSPVPRIKLNKFRALSDPKLSQATTRKSTAKIPTLSDKIDRENSSSKALPLENYLKFLNSSSKGDDLNSFRERMSRNHLKSFGELPSIMTMHTPNFQSPTSQRTITLPNSENLDHQKSSRPKVPSFNFSLQALVSPSPTSTKRITSPRTLQGENSSRPKFTKQTSRKRLLTQIDDNTKARQLAEEIDKNYQLFEENASKSKELKLQLTLLLKKVGLLKTFSIKNSKLNVLVVRIYNDMLEECEPAQNISRNNSPRRMMRTSSMTKFHLKGKLIQAKYEAYKSVNETLEEILLQYKLQNLKRLENNLLQAHDDLMSKKQKILNQLELNDFDTFCRMKKNLERLGDVPASYYSEHVEEVERLQRRYGENIKIDESQKILNKGLGEILQKWTNKVQ